jgi:hypothetical protein
LDLFCSVEVAVSFAMVRKLKEQTRTFRKMRLVPVDENEVLAVEKKIHKVDPAISVTTSALPFIEQPTVQRGDFTTALAEQNANIVRFKALEQHRDQEPQQTTSTTSSSLPHATAIAPLPDIVVAKPNQRKLAQLMKTIDNHRNTSDRPGCSSWYFIRGRSQVFILEQQHTDTWNAFACSKTC